MEPGSAGGETRADLARQLRRHVEYLASPDLEGRKPGTPGNRAAAEYIAAQFQEIGLCPLPSLGSSYAQTISPLLGDNLVGFRPPMRPSPQAGRWLLLGAHYDHLGIYGGKVYYGADDNASAIAILLETARGLGALEHFTFGALAFNAEEPPYFLAGSTFFVEHLPREIGDPSNIQAVLIMDLMGGDFWEPLHDVVFALGAETCERLSRKLKETAQGWRGLSVLQGGIHLVEEIPLVGPRPFSDYHAFRNARVPFVFLSSGRTPRYHKPTDRPDTLNYERMAQTVCWLQTVFQVLDEDADCYLVQPDRIDFADEVQMIRPLIALAADPRTQVPGTSPLTRRKLQRDAEWLRSGDALPPTPDNIRRLERISMRLQCLLADFPLAFLL